MLVGEEDEVRQNSFLHPLFIPLDVLNLSAHRHVRQQEVDKRSHLVGRKLRLG
jgi:hypothetical protein